MPLRAGRVLCRKNINKSGLNYSFCLIKNECINFTILVAVLKKTFSILLLVIFSLSQYGKFISYAYCLLQAEAKAVSCDCQKQLGADSKNTSEHAAQLTLKDKYEEPYITTEFISLNLDALQTKNCFANKLFSPAKGFERPLLHPPAFS